jgi:hypothetical protein
VYREIESSKREYGNQQGNQYHSNIGKRSALHVENAKDHSLHDSHRPDTRIHTIPSTRSGNETEGYPKKITKHGKRMFDREKERRIRRRRKEGGAVHRTPSTTATCVESNSQTTTRSAIIRGDAIPGPNN